MKLFPFNFSRSKQKSSPSTAWLRGDDAGSPCLPFSHAYQQVAWVYRAINVLAEQVANIPFLFSAGQRGRENLITSGPLLDFYSRPHPQINQFEYWELRIIWLMLRGECFRIPIFSNSNSARPRLDRVFILDPGHFQHIVRDHRLIGWRYTGLGQQTPLENQVFLPEEVWFEKLPNPFDFWRGLAPLQAAAGAARTDFAAAAFMRGIIENNADAGMIVRTERPLGPEQEQQLIGALRERKRIAGTADRPLLLSGVAEVIRPQLSSGDLQFLENRKFSRAEICAAFGVPEEILTATDHAKYDVMQGARQNFIENRVAPLCRRLEAEEDRTVKAIDPGAAGWFDLDSLPILQQARQSRLDSARTGFEMGIPFNELNRVLDLGFRPMPWGDTGYLPSKLQKVGTSKSMSPERASLTTQRVASCPETNLPDCVQQFLCLALGCSHSNQNSEPQSSAASPQDVHAARVKLMTGKLRKFFFAQRSRVLQALTELKAPVELPLQTGVDQLFNCARENKELEEILRPLLTQNLQAEAIEDAGADPRTAQHLLSAQKSQRDFASEPRVASPRATLGGEHSRLNPEGVPAFTLNTYNAQLDSVVAKFVAESASINQLTRAQLAETLKHGLAAEETADLLAARVKAVFNHASNDRADPIALAQTLLAIAAGRELALKNNPGPEPPNRAANEAPTHLS